MVNSLQSYQNTWDFDRLTKKDFSELIEEFLQTKKSSETQKAYRKDVTTFFNALNISTVGELATLPVYELSKIVINYIESFKKTEEHRQDRVHNPRTLNRKAYALSSFFEYLVANYGYPRNPVKVYTPYSTPDKTSTQDLETEEIQHIRNHLKEKYESAKTSYSQISNLQKLLIFSFLFLSLRRNEIAHIRRDDRNTQKWFITIFGKGQKYKYLPLWKKITEYLLAFREKKIMEWFHSPYVFSPLRNNSTWDTVKPITWTYIFNLVKKVTHKLQCEGKIEGTKKITPHSFRTSFVKMALNKGKTDIEIMNTTWHSTSQMVKYYDSRSPLEVNAAEITDDLFE